MAKLNASQLANASMQRASQTATMHHAAQAVNDVLHIMFFEGDFADAYQAESFRRAMNDAKDALEAAKDIIFRAQVAMVSEAMGA